jgi:ribosomal protein S18 acetylase RimI-like enzyme
MSPVSLPIIRPARPADHDRIVRVVDEWWGRPIRDALPSLFLEHFFTTSRIAERDGSLVGFVIGFCSPSVPDEAYIHFLGVAPNERGQGLARHLYQKFFQLARANGRTVVRAITSPVNTASIAFHRRLGFTVTMPGPDRADGRPMVRFRLDLVAGTDPTAER